LRVCPICGGMLRAAIYTARDERDGTKMVRLPAAECVECGGLEPDAAKIEEMAQLDVPSSVRIRCGIVRRAG
jgi:uncharacterized Zn finger protein